MVSIVDIHANSHTHTHSQTDNKKIVEVMHNIHCNRDVSLTFFFRFAVHLVSFLV